MGDNYYTNCPARSYGRDLSNFKSSSVNNEYIKIVPSLDYYLYMGQDEGQMGFIDAVNAGVETIVTPQGYHLDAEGAITYGFNNFKELVAIFQQIAKKRRKYIDSVSTWTWNNYAKNHYAIWQKLCSMDKKNSIRYIDTNSNNNSLKKLSSNASFNNYSRLQIILQKVRLFNNYVRHKYFTSKKIKYIRNILKQIFV